MGEDWPRPERALDRERPGGARDWFIQLHSSRNTLYSINVSHTQAISQRTMSKSVFLYD